MPEPTVACVMLTANRPEMAWNAVECYLRQTMPSSLLVFDTGEKAADLKIEDLTKHHRWMPGLRRTVGELRNAANAQAIAEFQPDIICHWDDDDYSAPRRIEEQVQLLQASGAQAVGYNSMLFWREPEPMNRFGDVFLGEAWLYTGSILGTSLCYWRASWERKHFEAMSNGEDTRFLMGMKTAACSSIIDGVPRMVARIHATNTSNAYNPQVMRAVEKQGGEWKRMGDWDERLRGLW